MQSVFNGDISFESASYSFNCSIPCQSTRYSQPLVKSDLPSPSPERAGDDTENLKFEMTFNELSLLGPWGWDQQTPCGHHPLYSAFPPVDRDEGFMMPGADSAG